MRFDDIFKRCFVVVICFLLGAAAYFQASGMMRLTGAALDLELEPKSVGSALDAARAKLASQAKISQGSFDHATSADVILERNPFDSVTGSLVGRKTDLDKEDARAVVLGADPYADPLCDTARVLLISESDDPEWSFAAIAGDGQKPILRRLGDEVGGHVMMAVARDRIWLRSNQARCQAILGVQMPAVGHVKVTAPGRGTSGGSGSDTSNKGVLPPDISGRIRRISENQLEVERSVISDIIGRQGELLGRVRVAPEKVGDRMAGIRLLGIKPGSLLAVLGMENGDRLEKINGMEIADPTSALEAYARLTSASHLVVNVERRGKPTKIEISIR